MPSRSAGQFLESSAIAGSHPPSGVLDEFPIACIDLLLQLPPLIAKLQKQCPHPWLEQVLRIFENQRNLSLQVGWACSKRDPMLKEKATKLVDHGRLPADPAVRNAMQCLQIQLRFVFDRHKPHGRSLHSLGNRFRIHVVVLLDFTNGRTYWAGTLEARLDSERTRLPHVDDPGIDLPKLQLTLNPTCTDVPFALAFFTREDRGQRVQNSVFECLVDAAQWVAFRASLLAEADPLQDSLRFYFLGPNGSGALSMWAQNRHMTLRRR